MKNFTKVKLASLLITLAVIAVFIAVSCAPPLEETGYEWKDANATRDGTQNSGYSVNDYVPSANIIGTPTYSTTAGTTNTITSIDVTITFPARADVLRGAITKDSLGFITFHTFTKNATDDLKADTLSAEIPFTLENRTGNTVTVKLTTSINTANAYSDLLLRVDGKTYTYDHGLKLDLDGNGKIESPYDDEYIIGLTIPNTPPSTGSGTKTVYSSYYKPGRIGSYDISISSVLSYLSIDDYATAGDVPSNASTTPNTFYFTAKGESTNTNTLRVATIGYITVTPAGSATTDERIAYYKDVGENLAKGIKLQKLSGTTWTDAGTAEYDGTAPTGNPASYQTYIVIKNVKFDHLAAYRLIWTGSANTETTGNYYGAKVRLYINDGDARPLNRTQVVGDEITPVNPRLSQFLPSYYFSYAVTTAVYSYDSENKNIVLKVNLGDIGYYWKNLALADFIKSFKVVYSKNGGSVYEGTTDLVYVDVKDIKFEAEGAIAAPPVGTEKGKNVLYITLDPNFVFDVNANVAYQNWLTNTRYPWEAAYNAYQQYLSDYAQWTSQNTAYQQARNNAYNQWDTANNNWQAGYNTWLESNPSGSEQDYIDDASVAPRPNVDDYYATVEYLNPGNPPIDPGAPGNEPYYTSNGTQWGTPISKGTDLYFRINDGISVSDNATTNPDVYIFGNPDNYAYEYFEFYEVF